MSRILSFILVRIFALAWILVLANVFTSEQAVSVTLLIMLSEALLGFAWGRAEASIQVCKPVREDPRTIFTLITATAIIESVLATFVLGQYAAWIIVWRVVTAYLPFSIVEYLVYASMCKPAKRSRRKK